jgi:hypothetical protein
MPRFRLRLRIRYEATTIVDLEAPTREDAERRAQTMEVEVTPREFSRKVSAARASREGETSTERAIRAFTRRQQGASIHDLLEEIRNFETGEKLANGYVRQQVAKGRRLLLRPEHKDHPYRVHAEQSEAWTGWPIITPKGSDEQ